MFPNITILGMTLYDICLVIAVVLVLFLADRMGILRGFSIKLQKTLILSVMAALIFGFFGAVFFQAIYNALKTGEFVIDVNTGMTFYGGLIFGVIGFLASWFGIGRLMCKSNEPIERFGTMADIAACMVPLAHGIGRIGCLTAGCCHGKATEAWYGINMYTEEGWMKVVPVQLFEALFLLALSGVLCWLFFKKFGKEDKGRFPLLPIYISVYGIWRFFIEYARADDRGETIISFLSPSQLVALVMLLLGVGYFLLWYFYVKKGIGHTPKAVKEAPENDVTA